MKNFTQHKIFSIKWLVILLGILFLLLKQQMQAQYISNNGAYVSISNGTVVSMDNITNDNATTLNNAGTIILNTLINAGVTQGNGTYTITGNFTNTGTVAIGDTSGTVDMNGTSAQMMTMSGATSFYNLTINNALGVTLSSTQTIITNNLTINSGKIFKIEAAKNLTVTGVIANYEGNAGFILESNVTGTASLIHTTVNVPATVKRYISGNAEDWHFLASPVSNQVIASSSWVPAGTYGNGTGYDLYVFDEPTPCWVYQLNTSPTSTDENPNWPTVHPTANFVSGRGYLYSVQASNPTNQFAGNLNNGAVSYAVTKNSTADPLLIGFNLIGNPYPSAIDWKASSGWTRSNLLDSGGGYDMWIWNPATNNYGVYNSFASTGTNGISNFIAPMQGFFVRADSNAAINMTNDIRVHTGASNWFKNVHTKNHENPENIKVKITSQSGLGSDEVLLQFGASSNQAGAAKLYSTIKTAPSAYLTTEEGELTVRYLTNTTNNPIVPLSFKPGSDGNYTVSIDFDTATYDFVLLEDTKTKTKHDLKDNPTYDFKATLEDPFDRFLLHFDEVPTGDNNLPIRIYYNGNKIVFDVSLIPDDTTVTLFDTLGRKILEKKIRGKTIHYLPFNNKNQVFIVKAVSNGLSFISKIFVY
ncbi:hypothetical protein [Polaribacter sp.]|jgi:hypothetical protein|uniref:hypothetical protein n=1 Tax=Polaribacter sp. TaxID=1920175 RepID=UPI003EE82DB4